METQRFLDELFVWLVILGGFMCVLIIFAYLVQVTDDFIEGKKRKKRGKQ